MRRRLLSLYPEAWRERYAEEMGALLDEAPPTVADTLDLLRGALVAHLRPLATPPVTRARNTIAYVLGCFIVFLMFGSAFAKTTEHYGHTEHVHPLLSVSHSIILVGAIVALGALALAAVPLAIASVRQARRTRDPALLRLIVVPPTAILVFAGSFGLLGLWMNAHHHRAGLGGGLLLGLCGLCAAAGCAACWAAPRAIMRRIDSPSRALAFSMPAVALVALSMAAVALATGLFLVGIVADAPQVGAAANGPGHLIDVTASIALVFAGMLALSVVAALSAARGLRSVHAL